MRLDPQVAGIPRVVKEATKIKDGSNSIHLAKGDMVFASVKRGSRVRSLPVRLESNRIVSNAVLRRQDPLVFPNPDEVNPERPVSSYTVFGAGMHNCKRFSRRGRVSRVTTSRLKIDVSCSLRPWIEARQHQHARHDSPGSSPPSRSPVSHVLSSLPLVAQVFSLKNVRRAAGSAGTLYRFNQDIVGTPNPIYLSAQGVSRQSRVAAQRLLISLSDYLPQAPSPPSLSACRLFTTAELDDGILAHATQR